LTDEVILPDWSSPDRAHGRAGGFRIVDSELGVDVHRNCRLKFAGLGQPTEVFLGLILFSQLW
jgi:hypothetical protein